MRSTEPFRDLPARTRALAVLSGTQWLIAAALLTISIVAGHAGSTAGMNWDASSGVIWNVVPDGPAERAGIRVGDRLAAVDGVPITAALPPFYEIAPWSNVRLLVERNRRLIQLDLVTANQWELRTRGFAGEDFPEQIGAVNEYLRVGVNLWILLIAAVLLYLRAGHAQARVAGVALSYWVGGNALLDSPGFGYVIATWPEALRIAVHVADLVFLIGFLALLVHFSLIFPRPFPSIKKARRLQALPYIIAVPVLVLWILRLVRVLDPKMRDVLPAMQLEGVMRLYSPGMLLVSISILALHFKHEPLEDDQRRLRWVLSSLIPPFVTWIGLLVLETVQADVAAIAVGRTLFWIGVGTGSLIFAWATARHRVFETRVLLRKSMQYALARGTLLFLIAIPASILIVFLWWNRNRSLADLVTTDLLVILGLLIPLVLTLQYRSALLGWIDRRFFREQYDSHQTLVRLITLIQKGSDLNILARLTLMEIEKALHPSHLSFWLLTPDGQSFRAVHSGTRSAPTPTLKADSPIVELLGRSVEPVQIDLLYPDPSLRRHSASAQFWIWLSVTRANLLLPLSVDGALTGFLMLGERLSEDPYSASDRDLLMTIARQLAITESYSRLEELARQDPLTAALNRHAYYSLIEKRGDGGEIAAGCVAIVDLDDLKKINDSLGHGAGDLAIRQVASAVRSVLRADDLMFRWGGDEFLVILFGINEQTGRERLAGVNTRLAEKGFSAMPLTVSIGIAPFDDAEELSAAIDRADASMYEDKVSKRSKRV